MKENSPTSCLGGLWFKLGFCSCQIEETFSFSSRVFLCLVFERPITPSYYVGVTLVATNILVVDVVGILEIVGFVLGRL